MYRDTYLGFYRLGCKVECSGPKASGFKVQQSPSGGLRLIRLGTKSWGA